MTSPDPRLDTSPGIWSQIRLVAERELRSRGGSRSFKVGTAITLLLVLGIVIVPSIVSDEGATEWTVAVAGEVPDGFEEAFVESAAAQDATAEVVRVDGSAPSDDEEIETLLAETDADAVLIDGRRLVSEDGPSSDLQSAVTVAAGQTRMLAQLTESGLSPEQARDALSVEPVAVESLSDDDGDGTGDAVSFIGIVVLFIAINSYGAWVLTGVLEEKSSRVVEVIISTMPPRALLAGKVLGIGALGLAQLLLTAVVALAAALIFDVVEVPLELASSLGSMLVWFILGFALYAVGYAAAGSLATRQEDAQSAAGPLTYVVLIAYFVSILVIGPNPESLTSRVLSQVPFIAPMAMPARIAQGSVEPWEVALSLVLMILGIWLMVRLAARIYERSLLRTGAPIQLWTAIRELRSDRAERSATEVR